MLKHQIMLFVVFYVPISIQNLTLKVKYTLDDSNAEFISDEPIGRKRTFFV